MKTNIKIWELSLLFALCVALLQATVESGRQSALSASVIRFHVIAASDSEDDQAQKVHVRDAVLPEIEELLSAADSAEEAEKLILAQRGQIMEAALSASGGEKVEFVFGRESYGYRETESYSLPAGEYSSLRLIIGEGEGHNWWGVIFPQIDTYSDYAEAVNLLDDDGLRLICEEDGFVLRFRFLEVLEKLKSWLAGS